jgi:hypothetical protein
MKFKLNDTYLFSITLCCDNGDEYDLNLGCKV